MLEQSGQTNASTSRTISMASPVTPQTLYADRLESAIGTLLLIHDREGHVRALDFHDFEPRMRRLLRLHYGAEGNDFAIEHRAATSAIRRSATISWAISARSILFPSQPEAPLFSARFGRHSEQSRPVPR